MAIQFRCTGCGQSIEVDDEFAGRLVGCPFCHSSVAAPAASQAIPAAVPQATPMGAPTQPFPAPMAPFGAMPGAVMQAPDPAARWCTIGLVCGILSWISPFVLGMVMVSQSGMFQEIQRLQAANADQKATQDAISNALKQWTEDHGTTIVLFTLTMGAFIILGLAASIVGLIRARSRKAQGVIGVIMCGICATCGLLQVLAGIAAGAAAG
ncbi:MAG: hypothetical protein L6R00_10830 [Phycisphaerae bacterium]|nr:hypothetical protein [Phycisphaerae bacterium]